MTFKHCESLYSTPETYNIVHQLLLAVYLLSHVYLFCDAMDSNLPGSSVHGISRARILEWVAISFRKQQRSQSTHRGFHGGRRQ